MYNKIVIPCALDQGLGPWSLELERPLRDNGDGLVAVYALDHVSK